MIVSIHQPNFLPWSGFFHKIALADVFVVFDDVQFEKNSFNNRNKVKTANGACWLTVPVQIAGKFGINIDEIAIDATQPWQKKHLNTILLNYKKAPYFHLYEEFIVELYSNKWTRLVDLNNYVLKYLVDALRIDTEIISSSSLNLPGQKSELVLNICKELNADIYISGTLGKDYLQEEEFAQAGVQIYYQEYLHPVYPQLYGEFLPYMSVIDLLFNAGPESKNILLSGNITRTKLVELYSK